MFYPKNLHKVEIKFMKFLLPIKAKFIPISERNWVFNKFIQKYKNEL